MIFYHHLLEKYDADDVDIDSSYMDINSEDFKPAEPKTNPEVIIESFILVKQFENLVTSLGKTFISVTNLLSIQKKIYLIRKI